MNWQQRDVYLSKELFFSLDKTQLAYVLTYAPMGSKPYYRTYHEQMEDTGLGEHPLRLARKALMHQGYLRHLTDGKWQLRIPRGTIFTKVPATVISRLKGQPGPLRVYCYLLLCSGRLKCAYPSIPRVKTDLKMAGYTFLKCTRILEDMGILDKNRRQYKNTRAYRSSCYFLRKGSEEIDERLKILSLLRKKPGKKRVRRKSSVVPKPESWADKTEAGHGSGIFRPPRSL